MSVNTSDRSNQRYFRINLWLLRWTSLITTPFFLVLCITGAILIFHDEIDSELGYVPKVAHGRSDVAKPMAEIVAIAQAGQPNLKLLSVFVDADHPERTIINMGALDAKKLEQGIPYFFNSYTSAALGAVNFDKTPTGFILELHSRWFLGFVGQLLGGLLALLVFVSLV